MPQNVSGGVSLTDQILAAIREDIKTGHLRPGEMYSVTKLAEEFSVSRTPVREALLRLAEARMIRFERNRGFVVLGTNAKEIAEVFHLRLLLEVPAVALAATSGDSACIEHLEDAMDGMLVAAAANDEGQFMGHDIRFHDALMRASGNNRLADIVESLRNVTGTIGASTVERSRSLEDIAHEHDPIIFAVRSKDSVAASAAMRAHLSHTAWLLVSDHGADSEGPTQVGSADEFVLDTVRQWLGEEWTAPLTDARSRG